MSNEKRATIYYNLWNEIGTGVYEFSDISIAVDDKCFLTVPLENTLFSYLKKVYADLAQTIFSIDSTIKPREVSFARNFDDIYCESDSSQFGPRLEAIFCNKLIRLRSTGKK